MSNIIVSPVSGIIEFNTGDPSGSAFHTSTAPIRLDATGGNTWFTGTNVGIGTTSPDTNLQIRDYTLDSKDILHLSGLQRNSAVRYGFSKDARG